jgi:nucleotide-binding universal stress UspA family protein
MSVPSSILVGIDFSDCSRSALSHALRIGRAWGAAVNAVHVVEAPEPLASGDPGLDGAPREVMRRQVADAHAQWASTVATLTGAGGVTFEVLAGSRLASIRRALEQHAAGLLVLGANGETRANVGLGTIASGCIRGVATDVLVVRDTFTGPFRTVVAGIDFSTTSRRALEAAAAVAEADGARLYAVHVVSAADGSAATQARLAAEHGPALEAFVAESRLPASLEPRLEIFPYAGRRSGLLEFGAVVNADLVAIGTRGRTNLRDVVLGSTAEKLLRDSLCAVWAAKPREDEPQLASSQPVTE